jgi:hypothetical protein
MPANHIRAAANSYSYAANLDTYAGKLPAYADRLPAYADNLHSPEIRTAHAPMQHAGIRGQVIGSAPANIPDDIIEFYFQTF